MNKELLIKFLLVWLTNLILWRFLLPWLLKDWWVHFRSGDHKLLHHSEKSFESMFQSKLTISSQIGESTNNGWFGRGGRNPRGREEEICKKNNHEEKDWWNINKPQG